MTPGAAPADAEDWLNAYGDYLFRFALARVRDRDTAEDLVQETLVSAIRSRDRFAGSSAIRTWLVGILKHKILDFFRSRSRTVLAADLAPSGSERKEPEETFFDRASQWRITPRAWEVPPDEAVERKEFQRAVDACIDRLPEPMARLFVLRDVEGLESERICEMLGISPSNLYTTLHRARFRLRRCLEENWFAPEKETGR